MTDVEQHNRSLLDQYFPGILDKLHTALNQASQEPLSIETLAVRGKNILRFVRGPVALLGEPPYHPEKKAKEIVEEALSSSDGSLDTLICIGSSFVTLLRVLLQTRKESINSIIVLEPDPAIFSQVIKSHDITDLLTDRRLKLLVSSNPNDCADALASEIHPIRCKGWGFILNPDSYEFYHGFLEHFRSRLMSASTSLRLTLITALRHSDRFLGNAFVNLASRPAAPDVSVFAGIAEKVTTLLVAAGPSLENHLELLQKHQHDVLIVCVGPAWKTLRAHSIIPHFVISIDPFDPNYSHFEGLNAESEWLISDLANNCEIVEKYSGSIAFCVSSDEHGEIFSTLAGRSWTTVATGGSVAHTAFNFCRLMKAKQIVLVGQDLAYTGGISHAKGHTGRTTLADEVAINPDVFREIPAFGGQGRVTTNKQMDVYRLWYERLPDKSDIVNATGGGARIEGIREVDLTEIFANLEDVDDQSQAIDIAEAYLQGIPSSVTATRDEVRRRSIEQRRLLSEVRRIRAHSSKCLEIMEYLLDAADRGEDLNELKKQYNSVSSRIRSMSRSLDLILSTLLKTEVFVTHRNFNLFPSDERKHLETNFSLHTRLVNATRTAEELLKLFTIKKG
ncbi:MAG: motility associated factor glycosyltransferase family protein [Candidatus Nanopelagicaceae bacterium]